jgi:hypothetical protein
MITTLSYTNADFASIKQELITKIQQTFPDWTDFNDSNTGVALLDLFALTGDMLMYYLNFNINEAFLPTAKLRYNVINICKKLGYELSSAAPASVGVSFTLSAVLASDVIIPQFASVRTDESDPVRFEALSPSVIPAGTLSVTVNVTEGQTIFNELTGTSDGSIGQIMSLGSQPVIDGTIELTIEGDVTLWTAVPSFVNSLPTDKVFITKLTPDGYTQIQFGDGVNGAIPTNGNTITAQYRIGGGAAPNGVGINKITVLDTTLYDGTGAAATVTVTNAAAPIGGKDEETLDHAKLYAPKQVKARNASISKEDFETNCEGFPGVVRALARTINEDSTIAPNTENIYIVPNGGGTGDSSLLTNLKTYLIANKPYASTLQVNLAWASYLTVTLNVGIRLKPNFVADDVLAAVSVALAAHFDYSALDDQFQFIIDWGKKMALEEIIGVIQAVPGVQYCKVTEPSTDIEPTSTQIIAYGTPTLGLL